MGASIASCFRGRNTVVPDTGEKNTTLDQKQVFAIDTMVALYHENVHIFLWSALAKFVWVVVPALASLTFLVSEIPLKYYINFSYTLLYCGLNFT